jgi:polyisoprenoid-binding protein YceI
MTSTIWKLLLCAAPLFAQESVLEFDPAQAHVDFTLSDVLHTVHGSFQLKRGTIRYDLAGGKASGEIVIDARSGNSGSDARDKRMHKNILESERYPEIVFTPDRVDGVLAPQGSSQMQVHGMFTIHGQGHELNLAIEAEKSQDQIKITTHFVIPYVQWGMKNPSTLFLRVGDKVDIDVRTVISPAAASR